MAIPNCKTGESIRLPLGVNLRNEKTSTLLKSANLELVRLVLSAGKEIPTHKAPGEITVQCLEGRVAFTAEGVTQELTAGHLLHLSAGQMHSIKSLEDSSVLLTLHLPAHSARAQKLDVVQEAGEESFPASDAPAY